MPIPRMQPTQNKQDRQATPWWKVGSMWLVIAFPLAAVIASGITIWLAMRSPDPVASVPATANTSQETLVPAVQARNQVADRNHADLRRKKD